MSVKEKQCLPLLAGDTVGLLAPSSAVRPESFERGSENLKDLV